MTSIEVCPLPEISGLYHIVQRLVSGSLSRELLR
jgi:hypothetical protein